jgi:hypothetical protein
VVGVGSAGVRVRARLITHPPHDCPALHSPPARPQIDRGPVPHRPPPPHALCP